MTGLRKLLKNEAGYRAINQAAPVKKKKIMASLKMNIPHHLSQEEALSRIKGLLNDIRQEQKDTISNLKEDWKDEAGGFQFTAKGFDVSGVIKVHSSSIDIDATVPFAVSLFKERIKEAIEKKAKELLA